MRFTRIMRCGASGKTVTAAAAAAAKPFVPLPSFPPMLVTFVRHSETTNNILAVECGPNREGFETRRHPDAPLTERGLQQAERVGARIAEENGRDAALIVCSYFHRAMTTAAVMERCVKEKYPESPLTVLVDRDFHETGGLYAAKPLPPPSASPPKPVSTGTATAAKPLVAKKLSTTEAKYRFVGIPGRTTDEVALEFPTFAFQKAQGCETGWWKGHSKESLAESRRRALYLWYKLTSLARREQHQSIVVVTHGHLYALMMHEAAERGFFNGPQPTPATQQRIQNTGVTRVLLQPLPIPSSDGEGVLSVDEQMSQRLPPAVLSLQLECCGVHVGDLGALPASAQPVS